MATAVHVPTMTKAERANQRNAVLAGFLGWTLDAFDFFILTLVIDDIAQSFGRTRPDIALDAHRRSGGATDRRGHLRHHGRSLRPPAAADDQRRLLRGHLSAVGTRAELQAFLILRVLFGIGMGGEWGVGASLALESASPRLRGLLSGLLQEGYAIGNLLSALAFRLLYPYFDSLYPGQRLAPDVLSRRPAGAALAVHPRQGEGIGRVARAQDRLGRRTSDRCRSTGGDSSTSCC